MTDEIITGLDIGTSKVAVVIGCRTESDEIEILGVGKRSFTGVKKGIIVNLEQTAEAIREAIGEAEMMAGVDVAQHHSIYVGLSGTHILGQQSEGIVSINNPNREIMESDIARVVEQAQTIKIPTEREIIHVLPLDFMVDKQNGIKDPIGMTGVRLETVVHIITGDINAAQNLVHAVNKAGYRVRDLVLESLASSEAILNDDERELGSLIIDVGGSITSSILFLNNAVHHTYVLPLGGTNVTRDISIMLKIPEITADQLKIQHGCAFSELVNPAETVEIPPVANRSPKIIPRKVLSQIIEARVIEILENVKQSVKEAGLLKSINAGIILTGGSSYLEGILDIAEQVFDLEARLGIPHHVSGLRDQVESPSLSTAVGLTIYGLRENNDLHYDSNQSNDPGRQNTAGFGRRISSFIKDIFS